MKKNLAILFALLFTQTIFSQISGTLPDSVWLASAPAYNDYVLINKNGKTILPNGRFITPVGKSYTVAPHPYGLTLSRDGNIAVTANSGTGPLSITIVRNLRSNEPEIQQVPPGASTDKGVLASVFMGLAISPENSTIYVGGGQENKVYLFDVQTGQPKGFISCSSVENNLDYKHGYIGDLKLSKDGNTLFAVDQIGFRLVIIDVKSKSIIKSVPVGRYPFGICLSKDEKKAYVANVGMFEYSLIKSGLNQKSKVKPIDFPAFAYGSDEMKEGIKNDTVQIEGLGEMNSPQAFSVFILDIADKTQSKVIAKVKTGHLVGAMVEGIPAVGGSSPNSIVATDKYIYVSNGNNDNISVISSEKDTVIATIYLKPDFRMKQFRGVIPFGLALSTDNKRLYVAESGINAIAVIDIESHQVIGHIPSGWFPSKLEVTSDGKYLVVANAKGFGSGPNGGKNFKPGPEGSYIGSLMKGTIQILPIPNDQELKMLTEKVIVNNFNFKLLSDSIVELKKNNPVPIYPGFKNSPIKHIVFISKENRTYDEVFGNEKNARGDSTIVRYGENISFKNEKGTNRVNNVTVMPNHLKLAREFSFSDNFYVDSDVSADGHRWLVNTYPNEWCETSTAASYGGNRDFNPDSKAPGVYAMNGAAGAIYPEDYNEAGSMWDHLERNKIEFYNFGFSIMFEPALYDARYKYTGIRQYVNYPVPQPIFTKTSKSFPTYNMAIPDQFRVDQFIEEFNSKWMNGKDSMPQLLTVILPNDHGAGERPKAGYPYRESYMADNDLAVGRIVEYLSQTPYWNSMMIVITEDDAQNGVDHIDAHRSILMVISPWVKKNHVSHVHYSFGSLFKTFWNVLGLPYLNQFDAAANDLSDFFTDKPDFKPYNALPVHKKMFDPQKALDPFDEKFDWKALEESPEIDDVDDMMRESKEKDEYRLKNREKKEQKKKNN